MTERIDFSGNARVYDRRHGAALPDEGLAHLWEAAGLYSGASVLDVGAGTGRVAIPLARRGCSVVALEPAHGMVSELRAKAGDTKMMIVLAEGCGLPFASCRFHCVVIARLLYLTADWPRIVTEAERVLAPGGCLLHEWGNGRLDEEWVQIREEARRLFVQSGIPSPFHPGVRSEPAIDEALAGLGLVREAEIALGPGSMLTLREFLRRLVEGELSYTWSLPEQVQQECLPRLARWAEATFDLERLVPMPRQIQWTLHRKPAASAAARASI